MKFLNEFFKKDKLYLEKLSISQKKLLLYFIIFFSLFVILFVKRERFVMFLMLLLLFLVWKIVAELLKYYTFNNEKLKINIRKNNEKFKIVIKVLLFIQKWKNPILLWLLCLDKLLLKILSNLVYNLKIKYKYEFTESQLYEIFYLLYFIINCLFGPLKLTLGFVYSILYRISELPFTFFFIIRMIGFVLSVLIFSNILKILYIQMGLLNLVILIYILLILLNLMIIYIDSDFAYLKIQYIKYFINADYLIYLRNNSTLIGILILNINRYMLFPIERKYINVISSILKIEIEEGYYKYWEFYKRNTWFITTNMWKEIKNRPSFYFYINLMTWLSTFSFITTTTPNYITNILHLKYKMKNRNLELPEEVLRDMDHLYEFYILKWKLLLFVIWDIDKYTGNKNKHYINYKWDEQSKIYIIKGDLGSYNYLNWENFKVENNDKDLPYYDPENNMRFFDKLYNIIGLVPYNENPLKLVVFSDITYMIEKADQRMNKALDNFIYKKDLIKRGEHVWWTRGWACNITKEEDNENCLIEEKIKDWIIKFLKESREEWHLLLEKERIEDRNLRLIHEIENIIYEKIEL